MSCSPTHRRLRLFTSAIALTAAIATGAAAQDFTGAPVYGEYAFTPGGGDVSAAVRAAGALAADRLSPGCAGYISEAPTLAVELSARGEVYFAAGSDEDTTMALRLPDGSIRCNDDMIGLNPGIHLTDAQAGRYEIWLGTFAAGAGYPPAAVHISSGGFNVDNPFSRAPDPSLAPELTQRLRAGFRDDPRRFQVMAGGDVRLDPLGPGCVGYARQAPDAAIDYEAGRFPLYFLIESEEDATMAVRSPSGEIVCNDDMVGLNPGVAFSEPESGRYLIWSGLLYPEGRTAPGELSVSEIGYGGVDNRLDLTAPALYGERSLRGGFTPDPAEIAVTAGGPIDVAQAVQGETVAEGYCTGFVTREPTLELTFEAGALPLYISAVSDADTTLAVNTPDGAWFCNDDDLGLNPGLRFSDPQSGVYDIYLGTFSAGSAGADAVLLISELGTGPDPAQNRVDIFAPALFGDHALRTGFLPDPHVIEVEAGGPLQARRSGVESDGDWCVGYVTAAPTVQLEWAGNDGRLSIFVESDVDTTLSVNMPDGSWRCDDDGGRGVDAALQFDNADSGVYDIYVGTFGQSAAGSPARLNISEFAAPGD